MDVVTFYHELVDKQKLAPEIAASLTRSQCLMLIAGELDDLCRALHRLGVADASTPMGALEVLSKETCDGFAGLASAIAEGFGALADAIPAVQPTLKPTPTANRNPA